MSQVKVSAYSAAHASTFVATAMLRGLKQIIVGAGLDPGKLADDWTTLETGIAIWLKSGHLKVATLEVWDSARPAVPVQRFDFTIDYSYHSGGDGELWLDPRTVRQAILKAGAAPGSCDYRVVIDNADGRPEVPGFQECTYLSTNGMTRRSVGTAVGGGSLGAGLAYWVRS